MEAEDLLPQCFFGADAAAYNDPAHHEFMPLHTIKMCAGRRPASDSRFTWSDAQVCWVAPVSPPSAWSCTSASTKGSLVQWLRRSV